MPSERELIELSGNGDAAAFTELIGRYEDRIFRLAKHVCVGLPSDADDVYQGTWLYRIASNLCFMRYRKKKSEPFVPLLDRPHDHDHDHDHGDGAADSVSYGAPTPEEAARKKELLAAVKPRLHRGRMFLHGEFERSFAPKEKK